MFRSLEEIKRLRRLAGINQSELAQHAGVSQSLIAKIESGKVEPTYSNALRIFDALDQLRQKQELKAREIMNEKVIFAKYNDLVINVTKTMKRKGVSQIPVLRQGKVCGLISESTVLKEVLEHPDNLNKAHVKDLMDDAPPIVSPESGLKMLLELLKDYPIVLVAEKGEIKGIISKADLLGRI